MDIAELGLKVDSRGVVSATKDLNNLEKQGAATEKRAVSMGKAFGAAVSVLATGGLFKAVIDNTIEQERVTSQLNAVLKSTGKFSDEASQSLQDYASYLQSVTTYGDEAILSSTNLLLTFTRIGSDVMPEAQEAVLNVATAMGIDLKGAAVQVGKALNDPLQGINALTRSGITFSDEQRKLIKSLVETGRVAEAQRIILAELETQFGGSARAARDTFGGAIQSLKNAFGDLLEGGGGNVNDATQSINDLTDLLNSPETKQGFQTFVGGVLDVLSVVAKIPVAFSDFGTAIGEIIARLQGYETIQDKIASKQEEIEAIEARLGRARKMGIEENIQGNLEQLRIAQEELATLKDIVNVKQAESNIPSLTVASVRTDSPAITVKSERTDDNLGALIKIQEEEIKNVDLIAQRYEELEAIAKSTTESLRSPQEVFQDEIELLNELRNTRRAGTEEGLISYQTYVRGVEKAQDRLQASMEGASKEINQFAIEAARNIQDQLGDSLVDIMNGNFDDIADSFKNMLDRMVAEAIAQNVAGAILGGDFGTTGELGEKSLAQTGINAVSGFFDGFSLDSLFGGFSFEGGGYTGSGSRTGGIDGRGGFPAILHPNETVIDHTRSQPQAGANIYLTQNFTVSGATDQRSQAQIAQAAYSGAQRAVSRNG